MRRLKRNRPVPSMISSPTERSAPTNSRQKKEGFWYSTSEPHLPKPKPNVLTQNEANEIYRLIKNLEDKCGVARYKGWSTSRITGEPLGSTEFGNKYWRFPADFGSHYVLKHRVKPSDEFLRYIGYKK